MSGLLKVNNTMINQNVNNSNLGLILETSVISSPQKIGDESNRLDGSILKSFGAFEDEMEQSLP